MNYHSYDCETNEFGRLYVLEYGEKKTFCECSCGNLCKVKTKDLFSGKVVSCGCGSFDIKNENNKKHPLYKRWINIKNRCQNPNSKSFEGYGNIGVTLCPEWQDYNNFYNWCVENGYRHELQLDRKDVYEGYSPSNCRFITPKENINNRKCTIKIKVFGMEMSLSDAVDKFGIDYKTLYSRVKSGWPHEKAVSTPVKKKDKF